MSETKPAFDALVDELGIADLAKAIAPDADTANDDERIEVAAAEGEDGGKAEGEGEGEGKPFGKSFKLKLDDGTEVDAVDGSDLVKSILDRVEANELTTMGALKGLVDVVKPLGELVKSLQAKVTTLEGAGKGRKAVLTVTERPVTEELKKSDAAEGMAPQEFLAKAMDARAAGRISGHDVSVIEQHLNMGQQPNAGLVRAVLGS